MNKQKFVEYLRSPESISASQFEELEQLLVDYPYFSIAKSVAARASNTLNAENKSELIASAAIYATDRRHLKRYVNGEVIFLADAPQIPVEAKKSPSPEKAHEPKKESPKSEVESAPSKSAKMEAVHSDVDQILDELHRDMEELKKSRLHFVEIQNQLDEETPTRPTSKEKPTDSVEPKSEEKKIESAETHTIAEKEEESNITNLIDSLKKEFAEEENENVKDEQKEEAKASVVEPKKEPKKEALEKKKEKPKKKAKAKKAESKKTEPIDEPASKAKEEKPEIKEQPKPEPPKAEKPSIVTNMDDGDDDEETTVLDPKDKPKPEAEPKKKKEPARANRGSRQKVKREDLEKLMGFAAKKAAPTDEPKDKKDEKEKAAPKKTVAKKVTEPKKEAKPPVTKKSSPKKIKKAEAKTEEQKETPKPEVAPKKEDETSTRSSAKAFKDFGGTGDMSSSVSRASSSRRKRGNRSSKSNSDSGEKKGGDDDDKSGPNDLIEKFITENPSIQRRALKGDKSDLSEKSTEWQPDIASEYLAEIYLKQGNKQRAIQIYEALMLKFPEKKSYFAGLIEKVQG